MYFFDFPDPFRRRYRHPPLDRLKSLPIRYIWAGLPKHTGANLLELISKEAPDWAERRRKVGWSVVEEGGTISEFGRRVGIQPHSASGWLRRNDRALYRALKDGTSSNILPREKRLERLVTYRAGIAEGLSHTKASERCGVSQNRMRVWLAVWAPDGIDQAIEDEAFDELFETFVPVAPQRECA